jgi:hypothetical protein
LKSRNGLWPSDTILTLKRALAIFRETGDPHSEAMALSNLGMALSARGQVYPTMSVFAAQWFEEAASAHRAAASIYCETSDRHGEGMTLNNLGVPLRETLNMQRAITVHQEAAAIFRQLLTGTRRAALRSPWA